MTVHGNQKAEVEVVVAEPVPQVEAVYDPLKIQPRPQEWTMLASEVCIASWSLYELVFTDPAGGYIIKDTGDSGFRISWAGSLRFIDDQPVNATSVNLNSPVGVRFLEAVIIRHKIAWKKAEIQRIAAYKEAQVVRAEKDRKKGKKNKQEAA